MRWRRPPGSAAPLVRHTHPLACRTAPLRKSSPPFIPAQSALPRPCLRCVAEIILTGASAGGIGVWINVDYIGTRFPAARVTAVPIAGL